jgi:iron complex outermembrane receptor protein
MLSIFRALAAAAAALLLLTRAVSAQDSAVLSGRVLGSDGKPVAGVSVVLGGAASRTTRTDAAGRFRFEGLPAGRYDVSVSTALGNAAAPVEVPAGASAERELRLGLPRVSETVSVEGPAPGGLTSVPGGSAVVDRSDLAETRASNFKDVFALTPGVLAQPRFGADESQFSIRGSGLRNNYHSRGVNLFVNGIPYQDADGFSDFEALEFMAAQKVEVWKGANALRFGANSSGGAVNLVTEDPSDAAPLQFRSLGGSYGFGKAQLSSGGKIGDAGYYLSLSGLTLDGFREHGSQGRERLLGNFRMPLSASTDLQLDVMQAHVSEHLPGSLTKEEMEANARQADPANVLFDWGRFFDYYRGGLRLAHRFEGGGTLSVTGFGSYRGLDHPIYLVLDEDTRNYGGEVRYALDAPLFGRSNRFVAGFVPFFGNLSEHDYVNDFGRRGALADRFTANAGNLSLYVEDQWSVTSAFTIVLGTGLQRATRSYRDLFPSDGDRSDDKTYEAATPKLGVLWSPTPAWQVFANASRSYEPPLLLEMKSYGSPGFLPLAAQDTWQYEIGSRGRVGESFSWDVSVFDLEIENEIINLNVRPFPDAPFTIPTFRNVPKSRHFGAEVGVAGVLAARVFGGDRLSGRAAYTYSDFRFVDDPSYGDNALPGAPRNLLRAELRYDAPAGFWIAPSVDTSPSPYFVDSANTAVNDRYVVWNLKVGWDGPAFGVYVEAVNLGNTIYSASVQVDNDLGRYYEPANGRSVAGGLRWRM